MTDKFKITGTIYKVFDLQVISDKFSKKEFILEIDKDTEYPQLIKMEATKELADSIIPEFEGCGIDVHFNIRGREWTNPKGEKIYFTNLQAWKIENLSGKNEEENPGIDLSPIDSSDMPF